MKKVDKKTLLRVWDYLKFYKMKFFGSILLSITMTILNVLEPFIIGFAITEIGRNVSDMLKGVEGAGINYDYLSKVLLIYFVRALLYQGTNLYSQLFMTDVVQDAMHDLRKDLSNKLNRLPIAYFDSNQFGEVSSKVPYDVDSIANALTHSLPQLMNAVLQITFAIILLFTLSWKLALTLVFMYPFARSISYNTT